MRSITAMSLNGWGEGGGLIASDEEYSLGSLPEDEDSAAAEEEEDGGEPLLLPPPPTLAELPASSYLIPPPNSVRALLQRQPQLKQQLTDSLLEDKNLQLVLNGKPAEMFHVVIQREQNEDEFAITSMGWKSYSKGRVRFIFPSTDAFGAPTVETLNNVRPQTVGARLLERELEPAGSTSKNPRLFKGTLLVEVKNGPKTTYHTIRIKWAAIIEQQHAEEQANLPWRKLSEISSQWWPQVIEKLVWELISADNLSLMEKGNTRFVWHLIGRRKSSSASEPTLEYSTFVLTASAKSSRMELISGKNTAVFDFVVVD